MEWISAGKGGGGGGGSSSGGGSGGGGGGGEAGRDGGGDGGGRNVCWVWWRTPEEWAVAIAEWVSLGFGFLFWVSLTASGGLGEIGFVLLVETLC